MSGPPWDGKQALRKTRASPARPRRGEGTAGQCEAGQARLPAPLQLGLGFKHVAFVCPHVHGGHRTARLPWLGRAWGLGGTARGGSVRAGRLPRANGCEEAREAALGPGPPGPLSLGSPATLRALWAV